MEAELLHLDPVLMSSLCPWSLCVFPLKMSSSFVVSLKVARSALHRRCTWVSLPAALWLGREWGCQTDIGLFCCQTGLEIQFLPRCLSPFWWNLLELKLTRPVQVKGVPLNTFFLKLDCWDSTLSGFLLSASPAVPSLSSLQTLQALPATKI